MEYAIVTLTTPDGSWKQDFELPVQIKIRELEKKLLSVLQDQIPNGFFDAREVYIKAENQILDKEKTLAEYQIWDGSILVVSRG